MRWMLGHSKGFDAMSKILVIIYACRGQALGVWESTTGNILIVIINTPKIRPPEDISVLPPIAVKYYLVACHGK